MKALKVDANIVIVANQFNPSIIDRLWLFKYEVLTEDDFLDGSVFIPILSQVRSKQFNLTVLPEQLQFSPLGEIDVAAEIVRKKLGLIIDKLPETPYTAIGSNFYWHLQPTKEDIHTACKRLFFIPSSRLYEKFETDDALFGAYLSKNELGSRLKLDIKPITLSKDGEITQVMQFAFNFHVDLNSENRVASIHEILDNWETAGKLTESIVNNVVEEHKEL